MPARELLALSPQVGRADRNQWSYLSVSYPGHNKKRKKEIERKKEKRMKLSKHIPAVKV